MNARDYEAWRPALIAFYRAECCFQSAENLDKFRMPLSLADKRVIDALKAAAERMPPDYQVAA